MTHGWQSESTDGPTGGWGCRIIHLPNCLSIHPSILLFSLLIYLSVNLSISLSFHPSAYLSIRLCSRPSIILFLSMCPSVYLSLYFSLSRSVKFSVSLCVLLSVHLSSCLSGHPAIHSIHLSTEAFHQSISLVLHLST